MDADWDEIVRITLPPPSQLRSPSGDWTSVLPTQASAVAFDDAQELLWVGNDHGRVASFYGPQLQRYTSVKAHLGEGPVRQLLLHEKGVLSVASKSVHLTSRKGLTQWHITHRDMQSLQCMSMTSTPNQLLVAGCQSSMFLIDIDKGQLLEQLPGEANYTIMRKSRYICAATDDGSINLLDPEFKVIKTWKAHGATINDMDARNDFLVTCGFSIRHLGAPIVDPLSNVYDLKNLRPLPPLPFHAGAAYVRLHPKLQTTSFVASQTGMLQVVDLMNPNDAINIRQANVQFMLGIEIAPSGDALAISDADCSIHLWGSPSKVRFNSISKETEFSDPSPANAPHVDWNEMPLNTAGMPYYHERLLSAWPSHMVFDTGAPPVAVEPVPYLQPATMGQYAPNLNPKKLLRYQTEDTRAAHAGTSIAAPKFLSEKAKEAPAVKLDRRMSDAAEALAGVTLNGHNQTDEERMLKYGNVEIKYSRFGVDDFDFRYYNKTPFSGLETHISNSFVNSLLQLYRFIPLIRNMALQHTATSCITEHCLLCELGFLIDMLEKAAGQNCQATNLLRTFSASREANSLGLLEETNHSGGLPLSSSIQAVNRIFLKQMALDFRQMTGTGDDLDAIISTGAMETIRCMYCGNETMRGGNVYAHELIYPHVDPKHGMRNPIFKFSSILKATIERENKNRGWCNKCRRYQQLSLRKTVQHLPFVMMLNAALTNSAMRVLWEAPGWLPTEIGLIVQNKSIYCFEGADLALHLRNKTANLVVYELVGCVAEIDTGERHLPHLVSMVNVDISLPGSEQKPAPKWHLFNDFLVTPVEPREALHFNQSWKLPSVVSYQVKTAHGAIDESWRDSLDTSLLFQPWSINGRYPTQECEILNYNEKPIEGMKIALDTEFVDLEKAEIDVKADGTQETIRPAKSGLARVSVLRGQGNAEGVPFIDDYITIRDSIVDYKTQYSGIRPGDLDPRTSSHNLVPLKVAYKKLWLLLNLGCIFIGHGLASDFRKINIQVPKAQTIDTQYLYLVPGKNRRFSLRYLAWAVFKEYIQEESVEDSAADGHDSIEDARMALRLWRKFQEYEDAGIVEQMVEEIYRRGTKFGWKPPPRDGGLTGANSAVPSGRNTPDVGGIGSAPSTPAKGFRLSAPNAAAFVPGSVTKPDAYTGSPLR
jgi:PAB-dependent poly(A)-specific ribonuclease subunit 2